MKLNKIELINFRSFYGTQTIEFSDDDDKNVTLIHAQNGVGKTNILNSVLWNFYGIFTGKFENKKMLFNKEALKNSINCSVRVEFTHEEKRYISLRSVDKLGKESTKIWEALNGNLVESRNPQILIKSIIPAEMATHFFFDGEHAETFSSEGNQKHVSTAIKQILGCQIAETTLKDLKDVRKKIEQNYKEGIDDIYLKQLVDDIKKIRNDIDEAPNFEENYKNTLDQYHNKLKDITSKLAIHSKTKVLQNKKSSLEASLNNQKQNLENIQTEISKWIDDLAMPLISNKILEEVDEILLSQKQKSKIPEKYQKSFVEELLSECKCVCGRDFENGSKEYETIASLLEESADSDQIDRYERVKSQANSLKTNYKHASPSLKNLILKKENTIKLIKDLEEELEMLEKDFKTIDDDEIDILKDNELKTKREIENHTRQFQSINQNIELQKSELKDKEERLTQEEKRVKQNRKFAIQRKLVIEIENILEKKIKDEIEEARKVIQSQVNTYLKTAGTGILSIKILEDFKVVVYQDGKELPKSGGQNQIISLVFTAALVWFSKIRSGARHEFLLKGIKAPLFLDAPFGQLDRVFQEQICNILPELSDQLIILFSDSQGNDVVRNILENHVGKQYIVESHVKNQKEPGMSDQKIIINDKEYIRAIYDAEIPMSLIKEVS